jgi:hypothetical protein
MSIPKRYIWASITLIGGIALLSNSSGAISEHTGAPGEQSCGRSSCHNVMPNQGNATIAIEFSDADDRYRAGETYTMKAFITNAATPARNGFQIVALDANNKNVGEWILTEPNRTKIESGFSLRDRRYITHTSAGNQQTSWSFNWKAPSDAVGQVTFYLALLDANNNGSSSGDRLYTTSKNILLDQVSSTQNLAHESDILVNNIADESLQLKYKGTVEYFLFSVNGQLIQQGVAQQTISTQTLENGIYFLSLKQPSFSTTQKIVVQH